jgi:hypothetical protein
MRLSWMNGKARRRAVVLMGVLAAASLFHTGGAAADSATSARVYTSSNAVSGNEIVMFARAVDGSLSPAGRVATGGVGNGGGLGNQGALASVRRWVPTRPPRVGSW